MYIDRFAYGLLTPTFAFALSVLGCVLGLLCAARAQVVADRRARRSWLVLASWAIGGTGVWASHLMAMLGFRVRGVSVRYAEVPTMASWIIALVGVGIGVFMVFATPTSWPRVVAGGVFAGAGVAATHYTALAAVRLPASVSYDTRLVLASFAVAGVGTAAAMALAGAGSGARPQGWLRITVAALLLAASTTAADYVAMSAVRVSARTPRAVPGIAPFTLLGPIAVFVVACIVVLLMALLSNAGTVMRNAPVSGIPAFPLPGLGTGGASAGAAGAPAIPGQRTSAATLVNRPKP